MIAIALIAGVVVGYLGHRLSGDSGVGTVDARWSCESTACQNWRAWPSLAFSRGSCPRFTMLVGNAHDDVIRGVLPAGTYDVAVLLGDNRLVWPLKHRHVTVGAGTTTHLGVMTVDPNAVPYPAFCD
jgi:hypothetical protein